MFIVNREINFSQLKWYLMYQMTMAISSWNLQQWNIHFIYAENDLSWYHKYLIPFRLWRREHLVRTIHPLINAHVCLHIAIRARDREWGERERERMAKTEWTRQRGWGCEREKCESGAHAVQVHEMRLTDKLIRISFVPSKWAEPAICCSKCMAIVWDFCFRESFASPIIHNANTFSAVCVCSIWIANPFIIHTISYSIHQFTYRRKAISYAVAVCIRSIWTRFVLFFFFCSGDEERKNNLPLARDIEWGMGGWGAHSRVCVWKENTMLLWIFFHFVVNKHKQRQWQCSFIAWTTHLLSIQQNNCEWVLQNIWRSISTFIFIFQFSWELLHAVATTIRHIYECKRCFLVLMYATHRHFYW